MRAVVYDEFGGPLELRRVPDPEPARHGVVVSVQATGVCRSDWHGWAGHERGIRLPHVPGHELAGVVAVTGADVTRWSVGDRVTVPFVCACGSCPQCLSGHQQVCDNQTQPGSSGWGSFADLVALDHADVNLVPLPESLDTVSAASLGCRFTTAYRAVVTQGGVAPGQWVAVHGCGGVGLSAVMVAVAAGAQVVGVDVSPAALALARDLGCAATVDAGATENVPRAVREISGGGVHVSLDALGSHDTFGASVRSLRKRGRHVQVGLMPPALGHPPLPMSRVIAHELEIVGSHGIPAHAFEDVLALVGSGRLRPDRLVTRRIGLADAGPALASMDRAATPGITVVVA